MATLQIIHVGDNPRPTRTIRLGRLSLSEAAAERGIDVQRAIRNLKQRARYALHLDRPKCFPDQSTISTYTWHRNPDQASRDLATLRNTTSTAEYVSIWCRLNHLKEC